MTLSRITDAFSEELSDIIKAKDNWTEEEKRHIQDKFMKMFGEVWFDVMTQYNHSTGNSANTKIPAYDVHAASSGDAEGGEALEEAEIQHEGTLIAVTKKRTAYPAHLAALLGKRRRLEKKTAEAMKVELPLEVPLEIGSTRHFGESITKPVGNTLDVLSKSSHSIQKHIHHLTHIADAAEIIINNQQHPIEALLSSTENL